MSGAFVASAPCCGRHAVGQRLCGTALRSLVRRGRSARRAAAFKATTPSATLELGKGGVVLVVGDGELARITFARFVHDGYNVKSLSIDKNDQDMQSEGEDGGEDGRDSPEAVAVSSLMEIAPAVVVLCKGVGFDSQASAPEYLTTIALVDAAIDAKVRRFVLVSALGAGDSENAVPFQVMDSLRPVLMDKSRCELYLRESGLEFTIVRPAPLEESEESGDAVLTEAVRNCYGTIGRMQFAELIVRCATSPHAARRTFSAVDTARLLHVSPYVRPREFWEPVLFDIVQL